MSQRFLNNIFLLNQFSVPRELNSPLSSEYDAESDLINFQNIFNFGDRNTNEMTNEDRNNLDNLDDNNRNNVVIDINSNNSQDNKLLGRKKKEKIIPTQVILDFQMIIQGEKLKEL